MQSAEMKSIPQFVPAAGPRSAPAAAAVAPPPRRTVRGPSKGKTDLTRSHIVSAALAEFLHSGIAQSSMDKIARRAGLAKGTLYTYFATKEALLEGALQETVGYSALAQRHQPRGPSETVRDYILRLVLPTMEVLQSSGRGDLARLVLGESRSYPQLAQFYREHVFAPWHAHFEAMMKAALDEGELRGMTAAQASLLLGAPFWISLAQEAVTGSMAGGGGPAALMRAQIDALLGGGDPGRSR